MDYNHQLWSEDMKKKAKRKVAPSRGKRRMVEVRFKFPLDKSVTCKTIEDEVKDNARVIVEWLLPCDVDSKLYGTIRAIEAIDSGAR